MSIPKLNITDKGIVVPNTQDVIDGLWDMFKQAFGNDLNLSMSTPQGQLVTSLAAIIQDERNSMVELLNQIDPRYSMGIWQDAIGYIYFMTRKQGTRSTATLTLVGLSGVVVEQGFIVIDENGNEWATMEDVTINHDGQAKVEVQCLKNGAVAAGAESINIIKTSMTGLDRVYNEFQAVEGVDEENRSDFEHRRYESVALNSKNTNSSTLGAVQNLKDVVDVAVVDNPTDETINVGYTNYAVQRNSILVSVVGGNNEDIAKTILAKAGSGCSFVGNTEVTIYDTDNYPVNPPEYIVKFLRPETVPIYFEVTLENKSLMSFDEEKAIKNAIEKAFNSGSAKAKIGQTVIASKFICPVAQAIPNLNLVAIRVSKTDGGYQDKVNLGIDEFPSSSPYHIKVV